MNRINSILLFCAFCFIALFLQNKVHVTANIIGNPSKNYVVIAIEIKNETEKPLSVNKTRMVDYKREKIAPIGNYVIELQILENGQFRLFEPSGDIDPGYNKADFIEVGSTKNIRDTIRIRGSSFARNNNPGFEAGKYRVRVIFYPDFWNQQVSYISDWSEFETE